MTARLPRQTPPSKFLALWIALPIILALGCCGAIGSRFTSDGPDDADPLPIATFESTTAPAATPTTTPEAPSPTSAAAVPPTSTTTTTRTTTTTKPPGGGGRTTTTTKPPTSVYYANCAAAKAAGAAPLYRGEPGYRAALDRDNDGVACET